MNQDNVTDVEEKSQAQTGATAFQILEAAQQLQNITALYFFVVEAANKAQSGGVPIRMQLPSGYQLAINSNLVGALLTEELNKMLEGVKANGIDTTDFLRKLQEQYENNKTLQAASQKTA